MFLLHSGTDYALKYPLPDVHAEPTNPARRAEPTV
jgi:hypothetical protein